MIEFIQIVLRNRSNSSLLPMLMRYYSILNLLLPSTPFSSFLRGHNTFFC